MRAAVLHAPGQPLRIEEVEIAPPRAGEVRIRVVATGVCRSDLAVARGTLRSPLPVVPGHETAGIVVEVADDVDEIAPGDRVVVALTPACGQCIFCCDGRPNLCVGMAPGMIGSTMLDGTTRLRLADRAVYQLCGVAGFAEEAVVCARACVRVPEPIPLERACLLGCGILTGAGAVLNTAGVQAGMSVAVIGCGGVGLAAVQAARIAEAQTIVAIDLDAQKLERARTLGATHTVDGRSDVRKAVRAITGIGVHVAIEAVGTTETIETAWSIIRPGGKAVVIGMPGASERAELRVGGFFQAKAIEGCVYGSALPRRDIPRLLELYQQGHLRLDEMVSEEVPLDSVQDALDALAAGHGLRHVIVNRAKAATAPDRSKQEEVHP